MLFPNFKYAVSFWFIITSRFLVSATLNSQGIFYVLMLQNLLNWDLFDYLFTLNTTLKQNWPLIIGSVNGIPCKPYYDTETLDYLILTRP